MEPLIMFSLGAFVKLTRVQLVVSDMHRKAVMHLIYHFANFKVLEIFSEILHRFPYLCYTSEMAY